MRRCAHTFSPSASQSWQVSFEPGAGSTQVGRSQSTVWAQLMVFPDGRSQGRSSLSHPARVHTELLLLALVVGALAVTWVCRRLDISAPLVLVVVGIAASFIPGVETVQFDPNVVLFAVLTPLLYSSALES